MDVIFTKTLIHVILDDAFDCGAKSAWMVQICIVANPQTTRKYADTVNHESICLCCLDKRTQQEYWLMKTSWLMFVEITIYDITQGW